MTSEDTTRSGGRLPCSLHGDEGECRRVFESTRRPWVSEDGRCTLLGLKTAIVSCRRAQSKKGRVTQEEGRTAYQFLDSVARPHAERLVRILNLRWIVSICDSYVDWGSASEARNAMLVSLLVNWERLAATLSTGMTGTFAEKTGEAVELWAGATTLSYNGRADTHRNLFVRLDRLVSSTPHIHVFFQYAARIILESDQATPRRLGKVIAKQDIAGESLRVLGLSRTQE